MNSSQTASTRGQFAATSTAAIAGLSVALPVGWAVLNWAPIRDPVEVVGLPLLLGYSERAETASWLAFVAAALTTGIVARFIRRRWNATSAAIILSAPVGFIFWDYSWEAYLAFAAAGFAVGESARWIESHPRLAIDRGLWASLVVLSMVIPFAADLWILAPVAPVLFAAGWFLRRTWWPAQVATLALTAAYASAGTTTLATFLCGAAFSWAGAAGDSAGRSGARMFCLAFWLSTIGWNSHWNELQWFEPPLHLLLGAAWGRLSFPLLMRIKPAALAGRLGVQWVRWLAPLALIPLALQKPWFVVVAAGTLLLMAAARPSTDRRWWAGLLAILSMTAAVLPKPAPLMPLDPFHDGQILSAVWEFESGRTLYDEVFPLRQYEFWLTWLGRRVLPQTLHAYEYVVGTPGFLAVGGIAAVVFVWTRSACWAAATAAIALLSGQLDGRSGCHFWLAAGALALLRANPLARFAGLAFLGAMAALVGFDCVGPLLFACTAAAAWPVCLDRRSILEAAARAVATAATITVPFTIVVALWQGVGSATAYWSLFVDFSRNYPAFYGEPIPWEERNARPWTIGPMVLCGSWAAAGAALLVRMSPARTSAWLFVLVHFVFAMQRGLGRSDLGHLQTLFYPLLVLGSLLAFEACRMLRMERLPTGWNGRRFLSMLFLVLAIWKSPHGQTIPLHVLLAWQKMKEDGTPWPAPTPLVQQRVPVDGWLWSIEEGLPIFTERRRNPTRHAIAYCIGSLSEQRRALEDLKRRPPALVAWRHGEAGNRTPNLLRYYLLSDHLTRNFRPLKVPDGEFLEPAPIGWPGAVDLDGDFRGPMNLGWLAERWGKEMLSRIAMTDEATLGIDSLADGWELYLPEGSRGWNFLEVRAVCPARTDVRIVCEMAGSQKKWEADTAISWRASEGGGRRTFLVPVGCSAAWAWRSRIKWLRIRGDACAITELSVRLLKADYPTR